MALRALLVASVVRSPRINIQEQQQKKNNPKQQIVDAAVDRIPLFAKAQQVCAG